MLFRPLLKNSHDDDNADDDDMQLYCIKPVHPSTSRHRE